MAEKERSEENIVLEKLQQKIKDLRTSMGGRIKQLEEELIRSESTKNSMKEKLEGNLREAKHELEIQEKIVEKYSQVGELL